MINQIINSGEFVYREGDASEAVHFILTGEIEVVRQSDQGPVKLAVLKDGQIFGEMGVIQDTVRSTTTQALTDVTMVSVSKDEFLRVLGPSNVIALPLLRMLCERLRNVNGQYLDLLERESVRVTEVSELMLLPDSHEMETQIGEDGLVIPTLPYTVGRHLDEDHAPSEEHASLLLRPYNAHQIDPEHFALEEVEGRLCVRDLGTRLGTFVNGSRIATFEHTEIAQLRFGDNSVHAGGTNSPYQFRIFVKKSDGTPGHL